MFSEQDLDQIDAFADLCIPPGVNPPPDLWRFVYVLRWSATEAWMEAA